MRTRWVIALAASGVVHAAAAAYLASSRDEARIAGGGAPTEIAILGNAFQDSVAAGGTAETLEPEIARPAENARPGPVESARTEPVAAPTAAAVEAERAPAAPDVKRGAPVKPAQAAESTAERSAAMVAEPSPSDPVSVSPLAAQEPEAAVVPPNSADENVVTVSPPPEQMKSEVATAQPPVAKDALQPEATPPMQSAKPSPRASQPDPEAVQPSEPDRTTVAVPAADIPLPTPRPDYVPQPKKQTQKTKPEKPKAVARKAPAKAAVSRSGARGKSADNQRRGRADGANRGAASSRSKARSSRAGNAAVSNYPGKVVAKLRRALRYPSGARRKRASGEVRIKFVISGNGSVGGLRVVRSSGSALLDQAALETVRRAAPFPKIPDAAGRRSWPFTVPLAFRR